MSPPALEAWLALDHHPDAWDEDGVDQARAMLAALDEAGWAELAAGWRDRPDAWQARLASALFGRTDPRARRLLVDLLRYGRRAGALAAAESLDVSDDWWTPDQEDVAALRRLAADEPATYRDFLLAIAARAGR